MNNKLLSSIVALLFISMNNFAQLSPSITAWLQNTTETGSYYTSGNSTAISNGILVNCQQVEYSNDWVYVTTTGVPSYPTGPFLDGNPSQAENQSRIVRFPLVPTQNTGTLTSTNAGNIGHFVNGVALFDYRDGVAWNTSTNALCGGPGNSPCPGGTSSWNRDAILAEMGGFDCSKGHPAMGNYHHHQNPTAFKLDINVVSNICNLYDADALYVMDNTEHSPLIGFAYDGFPIYGAYGYKNADGTGGITRIESGYQLRSITTRTHHADGTDVPDGPVVNSTYPLGYFREDYEHVNHPGEDEYLDVHNGRFCVTPEYPGGTYAYFTTVDANLNSAYPYAIGPDFYGNIVAEEVSSISEATTIYDNTTSSISEEEFSGMAISVFPNPSSDIIAIQIGGLNTSNITVKLIDASGKEILRTKINKGQTIAYFDTQVLYSGIYFVQLSSEENIETRKVIINK